MSKKINRRTFLIRTAAGLGAVTLTCGGLSAAALYAPIHPDIAETYVAEGNPMNQKILVTYATRAGSTVGVAQAVAQELTRRGYDVDVRPIKQAGSVSGYAGVVVGSAVRMGNWLPEALKFVETNQSALNQMPTAFFCVHLNNLGQDEASRDARHAYLDAARKLVTPQSEAFFAGVGDLSKLSFLDRMIAKMVKSVEGDFRDWDAIRVWSGEIL